jgi:hypothetical protein
LRRAVERVRGSSGGLACLARDAAASLLLFLYCTRFACILSSSFQTLQDKEERYCYSRIRPEGGGDAVEVMVVVLV